MSATHSNGVHITSRPIAWAGSVGAFVAAAALQIAIFGVLVTNTALPKLAAPISYVLAGVWLILPAATATFVAVRLFRLIGPEPGQRSIQALLALLLLPTVCVYLSVVISFNTWGGK